MNPKFKDYNWKAGIIAFLAGAVLIVGSELINRKLNPSDLVQSYRG